MIAWLQILSAPVASLLSDVLAFAAAHPVFVGLLCVALAVRSHLNNIDLPASELIYEYRDVRPLGTHEKFMTLITDKFKIIRNTREFSCCGFRGQRSLFPIAHAFLATGPFTPLLVRRALELLQLQYPGLRQGIHRDRRRCVCKPLSLGMPSRGHTAAPSLHADSRLLPTHSGELTFHEYLRPHEKLRIHVLPRRGDEHWTSELERINHGFNQTIRSAAARLLITGVFCDPARPSHAFLADLFTVAFFVAATRTCRGSSSSCRTRPTPPGATSSFCARRTRSWTERALRFSGRCWSRWDQPFSCALLAAFDCACGCLVALLMACRCRCAPRDLTAQHSSCLPTDVRQSGRGGHRPVRLGRPVAGACSAAAPCAGRRV
jgi:hypothetical protein